MHMPRIGLLGRAALHTTRNIAALSDTRCLSFLGRPPTASFAPFASSTARKMLSTLRVVHTPSSDNPTDLPVIILNVEGERYIFNAPEGTTRAFAQRGTKGLLGTRGCQNIFLPRVGVQECGGIFGIIMGAADTGHKSLTIHAPPVFSHYLATSRSYARRDEMRISVNEASLGKGKGKAIENVMLDDQFTTITGIAVLPRGVSVASLEDKVRGSSSQSIAKRMRTDASSNHSAFAPTQVSRQFLGDQFLGQSIAATDASDEEGSARPRNGSRPLAHTLDSPPLAPVDLHNGTLSQAPALTFIVRGKRMRGKMDIGKALAFGIPAGPLLKVLADGKDVELQRPTEWMQWDQQRQKNWHLRKAALQVQEANKLERKRKKPKLNKAQEMALAEDYSNVAVETVTIQSAEVLAPDRPGFAFVQVYLPTPDYLDNFLEKEIQNQFVFNDQHLRTVVHAVHPAILRDERYKSFMMRFPTAHHLISSQDYVADKLAFPSSALANLRMSRVDNELFKVPHYTTQPLIETSELALKDLSIQPVEADLVVSLFPPSDPIRESSSPDFDAQLDSEQVRKLESFEVVAGLRSVQRKSVDGRAAWQEYLAKAKIINAKAITASSSRSTLDQMPDLRLTALGTGSASPSKYRNVSGTLVHLPDGAGYALLDCGEGTYGQLKRKFGKGVDDILLNLRLLFLSHTHGDHHMGSTRLLHERHKLRPAETLYAVANVYTAAYLQEVDKIQSLGIIEARDRSSKKGGVIFLNAGHLDYNHGIVFDPAALQDNSPKTDTQDQRWKKKCTDDAKKILLRRHESQAPSESRIRSLADGLERSRSGTRKVAHECHDDFKSVMRDCAVFTAEVDHRITQCYGVVLRGHGWSVAYSGDTRPCEELVRAGRNVDVLIHEATFEEHEADMAHIKGHTTVAQAIDVAQRMAAKRLLLTHFSQRYPKLARLPSAGVGLPVGMAFDLMTMHLSDIGKTTQYMDALQVLFETYAAVEEDGDGTDDQQVSHGANGRTDGAKNNSTLQVNGGQRQYTTGSNAGAELSMGKGDVAPAVAETSSEQSQSARMQRTLVKDHEFQYVVAHIYPVQRQRGTPLPPAPTKFAFMEALQTAMDDLHGLIGASVKMDVVVYDAVARIGGERAARNDAGASNICAVIKVATPHAQTVVSTIAAGALQFATPAAGALTCRYAGTLSALDLGSLTAMTSRFQAVADGEAQHEAKTIVPAGSLAPPGRAWFEGLVASSRDGTKS